MSNRFNLIDEGWVPVSNRGLVSLMQLFSDDSIKRLAGTPVQKLAITKLLLAIAHAACTPKDDIAWIEMGADGLASYCRAYLEQHRSLFWLYGDKPFLQMSELLSIKDIKGNPLPVVQIGGSYLPDLKSDNDTLLFQSQIDRELSDAEKALFIVSIMNYCPGGKRTAKVEAPLTFGYVGKGSSAKSSPSLGNYVGYVNSFLLGESLIETIWLNLLTKDRIDQFPQWKDKELIPPWERMPSGEGDLNALLLKESFMATLCSLSRFVLLHENGILFVEGIQYPSHKEGWREPFIAFNSKGQMLWLDTSKKPWRSLTSLLQMSFTGSSTAYDCPQITLLFNRARKCVEVFGIWSGGLKVRGTAGDQSVKQTDDFIESEISFLSDSIGESWFMSLTQEMNELDRLSTVLYSSVKGYYKQLSDKVSDDYINKSVRTFWELCERRFQDLIDTCSDASSKNTLRRRFASYVYRTFDDNCPNDTARQMLAWAKSRPNLSKYLSTYKEEAK